MYVCDRAEPRKSNEFEDDESIANSTTAGNDHYIRNSNSNSGTGSGTGSGISTTGLRDLLTEEMFLQDSESELLMTADAEKIQILALSTKAPDTLLGWKVHNHSIHMQCIHIHYMYKFIQPNTDAPDYTSHKELYKHRYITYCS